MSKINKVMLKSLIEQYGDTFYLLDTLQFKQNFIELKSTFTAIYPNFNIAYSYKTNYIPKLCKIINENGGYAEIVSDMEMEIALRIGVRPEKIIWNGPFKREKRMEMFLLMGGTVNIDSVYEAMMICEIAEKHPEHEINIGIRVNFDIGDGIISRFGIDIDSKALETVLKSIYKVQNICLIGLQCHFASRSLNTWKPRVEGMLSTLDKFGITPKHIDLGGGLFGKMPDSLKKQFETRIPSYQEYAEIVAPIILEHFQGRELPLLLIEPGSALVGDCMYFVCKVASIKQIRGKSIATLSGSIYNINPTLNKKNPPVEIVPMGNPQTEYDELDFGGFTCIETDYLYRHFKGKLAVDDTAIFANVGSYSIVLKPPFILPNFPVIDMETKKAVKREEQFDDLFHTFEF